MNPVIVACAGPSLNRVDVYAPGYPIAAISTAIQCVPFPRYWILVDPCNPQHGPEGVAAMKDDRIIKVIQQTRLPNFRKAVNVVSAPRCKLYDDRKFKFITSNRILNARNQSVLFGIQWLALHGKFDTIIICGCDLQSEPGGHYAHGGVVTDKMRHCKVKKFRFVEEHLRAWEPQARDAGISLLHWDCGPVLDSFMERFDGSKCIPSVDERFDQRETAEIQDREPVQAEAGADRRLAAMVSQDGFV